jgi:hypothetical protein
MTIKDYIEMGLLAIIALSLWVRLGNPQKVDFPARDYVPASDPGTRPAHNPHIYTVRRTEAGHERVEELRNAMLDPANHAKAGAALRSPDTGVEWHDGQVEWGKAN